MDHAFGRFLYSKHWTGSLGCFDFSQCAGPYPTSRQGPRVNDGSHMLTFNEAIGQPTLTMSTKITKGEIYHLRAERGNYTLCGLRIRPFISEGSKSGNKDTGPSSTETLCKHCQRIKKQGWS